MEQYNLPRNCALQPPATQAGNLPKRKITQCAPTTDQNTIPGMSDTLWHSTPVYGTIHPHHTSFDKQKLSCGSQFTAHTHAHTVEPSQEKRIKEVETTMHQVSAPPSPLSQVRWCWAQQQQQQLDPQRLPLWSHH